MAQIRKEIYDLLISRELFPEEQKGYRKVNRGTGEQLYIDQHILHKDKTKRKNLAMEWIDYKKAYVICNNDDATLHTKPHSQEMHRWIKKFVNCKKNQLPNVHWRHQTVCEKQKRIGNPKIQAVRIYSQDIRMEFGIEKYAILIRKEGNDTRRYEWNYQIKKKIEHSK